MTNERTPARHITPQPWMIDAASQRLMDVLNKGKPEPWALFVGGCVRNALLGRAVGDIDIATRWTPQQVTQTLEHAGIKVVPTGIEHGTVTAIIDGQGYEITTLRRDVATDGRRAVVAFSESWLEDAQRRDFTMNTLLADAKGHIFDPTAKGLTDLEAGRVVFVGDPARRIEEDVLRILRFFRFHAYYGAGQPDEAGIRACSALAHKLPSLSRERVTQEFLKIIAADTAAATLGLMVESGVYAALGAGLPDWGVFSRLCDLQTIHDAIDPAARLYALTGAQGHNFLVLSNAFRKRMGVLDTALASAKLETLRDFKILIYRFDRETALQALLMRQAQGVLSDESAEAMIKGIENWDCPVFPVTGADLIKAGHQPGPDLGRKLKELEEEWIAKTF